MVIARRSSSAARLRILQRQRGDAHEPVGMGSDVFRHLVVLDRGERGAERGLLIVEIGLRRGRQHVHVDAGRIHVLQAARDIEAAGRERAVHDAGDIERGTLAVIGRDGHLDPGLGEQRGGFLGQNMAYGYRSYARCSFHHPKDAAKMPLGARQGAPECRSPRMDASPCRRLFIGL